MERIKDALPKRKVEVVIVWPDNKTMYAGQSDVPPILLNMQYSHVIPQQTRYTFFV